jgi:DNA polymerase III subunit epsilon
MQNIVISRGVAVPPHSFAAIDVETANADCASICQIGIVCFGADGMIVDEWQSLVNPEDHFDPINVSIHRITAETVVGAPTWPVVVAAVAKRLSSVAVSHTAFDQVSVNRAFARYGLLTPTVIWLDSPRVARRAWPDHCGKRGYGLQSVAGMLSLEFVHHVAVEDARIAGQIMLCAIRDTGLSVEDWCRRVEQPISQIAQTGNPEGPLFGYSVTFTGTLSMARADAARLAADAGCDVKNSVTHETTLLVVGDQDIRHLAGHEKSNKHRKAEELIRTGQVIRIICERDFLELVTIETVTSIPPS